MEEINEAKARELLEQLLREKAGVGIKEKVKIRDLEKRYLREKGKLSPKTVYNYHWTFDRLERAGIEYWFTEGSQVNEFISSLDVNDTSRNIIFGCLKAIGRYTARTYGWVDPTERASRPEVAHKQIGFKDDVKLLETTKEISVRNLIIELFPAVPEGVKVRPALNSKDLNLIRDGLIELMKVRGEGGSGSDCVQLIKRILRKV